MMAALPRVTELTRERIAREFDDLGPDACMAAIRMDLQQHNPELLEMASKWAADAENPQRLMTAFGMFYRLFTAEAGVSIGPNVLSPLPRVSLDTRNVIVARIDQVGSDDFTHQAIDKLEATNPELLQMAHAFASRRQDYARTMQGFALLYEALLIQSQIDQAGRH
jgi:hypothetical protein